MSGKPESPLGQFIREQRQLARLSLREMSRITSVSNAYLSQIERGLHAPSVRVLQSLAEALGVPVEELVTRGSPGASQDQGSARRGPDVEDAIRRDDRLTTAQKQAMISVYRGFAGTGEASGHEQDD